VAKQDGFAVSELVNDGGHIGSKIAERVGCNLVRPGAFAVTAHIKRRHGISAPGKILHLVTPGVPEFGKAMHTDDQWTIAGDSHVQIDGSISQANKIHGIS
jgi:hypothetical protein